MLLHVDQIAFRYPGSDEWALQDIELTLSPGKVLGLLGPNGAGKSTLMAVLSGLVTPQRGQLRWTSDKTTRPLFALVPQEYAFYPTLTCYENLQCFAGVSGLSRAQKQQRINAVVAQTELQHVLHKPAQQCSGGLKRRLNLAIGLLTEPQLLLLDEPTVGVDPQARHFLLQCVQQLRESGTSIIYTSHYMEEVQAVSDDIAIIDGGRILKQGTLRDLLQHNKQLLHLTLHQPADEAQRQHLHNIATVNWLNDLQLSVQLNNESALPFLQQLQQLALDVDQIQYGARHLEDVFLQLTQRQLRD